MHTHTPENSIFDGPVTNPLSILCILRKVLSRAPAKQENNLNDFRFGTFISHFPSDTLASMAVKGLIWDIPILNRAKAFLYTSMQRKSTYLSLSKQFL